MRQKDVSPIFESKGADSALMLAAKIHPDLFKEIVVSDFIPMIECMILNDDS